MLSLIGIISTLWLGASGKLELYIHPRNVSFTIIMSLIGAALSLAGFIIARPTNHHDHDHEDDPGQGPRSRLRATGSLLTVAAAVLGLLALPPATLTSATAKQRDLNSSGTFSRHQTSELVGADEATLDVRDWASLLRYDAENNYLNGKTATITGFVTMDKSDPADVFFVTRFVMTCCTVDAQPVGIPINRPGWQKTYKTDTWVTVTGTFRRNTDSTGKPKTTFVVDDITPTSQPARPYVY
jgi:uncharacterized repeat protein (TIGR03943 family)